MEEMWAGLAKDSETFPLENHHSNGRHLKNVRYANWYYGNNASHYTYRRDE